MGICVLITVIRIIGIITSMFVRVEVARDKDKRIVQILVLIRFSVFAVAPAD